MLRDYQQKLVDDIYTAFNHGARAVCAQAVTGSGKSVVLRHIVKQHRGYSCTIAHRQELVSQLSMHMATEGITHNIIAPKNIVKAIVKEHNDEFGRSFYSPGSVCSVASSQTLLSRQAQLGSWVQQVTLVAHDEGHHLLRNNAYGKAIEPFINSRILIVTATPKRTDKQGLGIHAEGFCDALVIGPSARDLIDLGYLSDYEIMLPSSDFDRSRLVIGATGEFTQSSLKKEAERSRIVGDVVETWLINAPTKQTIVFASDIETAEKMANGFKQWGVAAECVSSKTDEYARYKAVKAFREGQLRVLVNVALFDEGFDVPGVECVVMARPTQSLGLFLQAIGRALRPAPGKSHALIIDHVSNIKEHGLPDKPRVWSLDSERKKRDNSDNGIALTVCEECFRTYERVNRSCPYCNYERVPAGRASIEQVDGDLELLDAETLARMRAAIQLESPASMAQRVSMVAGEIAGRHHMNRQIERIRAQQELSDAIAMWAGYGRSVGKEDSRLYREFYASYGLDVLSALNQPTGDMRKLIERIKQ